MGTSGNVTEFIDDAEERYRRLQEDIPVGLYRTTPDGRVLEVNAALCRILGYAGPEEMYRARAETQYEDPEDRRRWQEQLEREGVVLDFETRMRRADGSVAWVLDSARAVRDEAGWVLYYQGSLRDITAQKLVQEALLEAEEKYRTLVERLPGIVYIAGFGERRQWHYLSPQVEAVLGFRAEEFAARPELFARQLFPDDRERYWEAGSRSRAGGDALSIEYRMHARDGRVVWFRDEATVMLDLDGRPALLEGIMFDVTERKIAEEELDRSLFLLRRAMDERQQLLGRLVSAQEAERQRIAADLHDDPVQSMTALGFRLYALGRELGPEHAETVAELEREVSRTVERLRTLMFELRPPALDRQGLAAAIELYLGQGAPGERPAGRVVNRVVEEPPPDIRAVLYRICQEAITNVRKHANADRVEVVLEEIARGIRVRITDDGDGYDPRSGATAAPGHLGLTAMRERSELAGGTFSITSELGTGTTVEVWVPAPVEGEGQSGSDDASGQAATVTPQRPQ
jgi:PAS domain S-box-containing protein